MSIAGTFRSSPEHRDRATVESLLRLAYSDSSATSVLSGDGATLGAVNEGVLWEGAGLVVAFSGTLYDRADLREALQLTDHANDAEFAGQALLFWGDEFPNRMDGEYAIAIWDGRQQRLLLSRDAMSRVPLFYSQLKDGWCFATEPRGLRGWPGVDGSLDGDGIARSLTLQPKPGSTLFRGISSALGGQTLVLQGATARAIQFWYPLRHPELRVRDWREYAECLHEAMVRAVARRLPASGLIGAQLSSGFDSSSVTALTAQALAKQNRSLVAYTAIPVQRTNAKEILNDRFDDEWPLASQVAAMYPNIEHVAIRNDASDWWEAIDTICDSATGPPSFIRNVRWYHAILKDAQSRGLVTMLEGQAGNLTGSYNGSFGLYDLRKKGRWLQLMRALRDRRRQGTAWKTLTHSVWLPSHKTRALVQRIRRKPVPKLFEMTMLRRDFYERSSVEQREYSAIGAMMEGDRSNGASWRYSILSQADMGMMRAMQMRAFGLRREDPTADRRLVELCLSIPDEAFAPSGIKRELYREAFRNDLPAELLAEPLRGLQASDFLPMFEGWLPQWCCELDLLEASPTVGQYLDLPRMRQTLKAWPQWKGGPRAAADQMFNYTFGGALAFGRFLRRLEDGKGV